MTPLKSITKMNFFEPLNLDIKWVHFASIRCSVQWMKKKIKQKMAQIGDLHDEILSTIILLLVTTSDGATSLARLSATCKKFHTLALESVILKAVNFQKISMNDYEVHHHTKDLLCLSARAKNLAAESRLGKALLHNDMFFWDMILEHDKPHTIQKVAAASDALCHEKLVRSFICDASNADLAIMRMPLLSYSVSFLGYELARGCGIMLAVGQMCNYYIDELQNLKKKNVQENEKDDVSLDDVNSAMALLAPPSADAYRDRLLALFDEMFPKGRASLEA